MNTKIFRSHKRKSAFFHILGISFFSFSLCSIPTYASSSTSALADFASSDNTTVTADPICALPAADTTSAADIASTTNTSATDIASTANTSTANTSTANTSTANTLSAADTNAMAEANDPDFIVIGNFSFRLSTASPETLAAYEAYQKATSYQNDWNMILVNKENPLPK